MSVSAPERRVAFPRLRLGALRALVERSVRSFVRHDMATYATALAFRGLLALVPFALFLVALLGFLRLDDVLGWLAEQGPRGLSRSPPEPVERLLAEVSGRSRGGLLSFGFVAALWSVAMGARLLAKSLNVALGLERSAPGGSRGWKRLAFPVVLAPALALATALAVGFLLVTSRGLAWLAGWVGLGEAFVALWTWLRVPAALVLLALVVAAVYRFAPAARLPFRSVLPGAVFAVLAWALASAAFSLFLAVFPRYGAAYGSLGAAISLLLYLYVSAAALLLGAEVNAALRRGSMRGDEEPEG